MKNEIVQFFMMELVYFLLFCTMKDKTKKFIKFVRINLKFYPRHYAMPNRLFRKIFELKKEEIAKYLYFSLWLAFASGLMVFIAPILFLCAPMVAMVTIAAFGLICGLDVVLMYIVSIFFER